MTSKRFAHIGAMVVGGLVLAVGLAFLLGFVVQALWNWLLPDLFGVPTIGYWQAWGLLVLSHILLGGGPRFHSTHKRRETDGGSCFSDKIKERWPHGAPHAGNAAEEMA